ncbi:lysophospholipid acyltransferase family protein [Mycoplasmopsis columbina]|uniref:lysophospholipid acyltransferase family protein n=1 Tax=Mycoplasmopsis columbina TaxID=114881 RepID=UPI0004A6B8D9|nr:lysophospholipid acyltransferase family protein [Mycoplasmopsis columbina]VEU76637.1 1-acyl-sn-glycerol-3-phosphate acyltransferase [Mycoplasmopsis columbina]
MNFNAKMIFSWPVALWYAFRMRSYARKYNKYPEQYTIQQRNDWLLKRAKFILWLFNVKVEVEGYDDLPKGPVILAPNHKSLLDSVIMLVALQKQTGDASVMNKVPTFLAKKELENKKLVKASIDLLDSFLIDRENFRQAFDTLNKFGTFVKEQRRYGIIFPEGTRVKGPELGEFKAGAFKVASSQYLPVVPVAILNSEDALNRTRKEKLHVKVQFLNPIKAGSVIAMETNALSERVKKSIQGALNNGKN